MLISRYSMPSASATRCAGKTPPRTMPMTARQGRSRAAIPAFKRSTSDTISSTNAPPLMTVFVSSASAAAVSTSRKPPSARRLDRAAPMQRADLGGREAPIAQDLAGVFADLGRRALYLGRGAEKARRRRRLGDAVDLDKAVAVPVVRVLDRLGHAQHRREADVGVLHDRDPL